MTIRPKLTEMLNNLRAELDAGNPSKKSNFNIHYNKDNDSKLEFSEINEIWGTRLGYDDCDEYDTPGNR